MKLDVSEHSIIGKIHQFVHSFLQSVLLQKLEGAVLFGSEVEPVG